MVFFNPEAPIKFKVLAPVAPLICEQQYSYMPASLQTQILKVYAIPPAVCGASTNREAWHLQYALLRLDLELQALEELTQSSTPRPDVPTRRGPRL